jgi:uncharacterized damage-inducible protein DinB
MENKTQLGKRFRDVILNNSWVANNSFMNQLSDLSLEMAQYKFPEIHTISELAQHVHYYVAGVLNVLKGGNLEIRDAYSFDFKPLDDQEAWNNFLFAFWRDAAVFAEEVERMDDSQLDAVFVKKEYGTYHFNINTLIEHSYYHLGQIILIKKLISSKFPTQQ